MPNEEIWNNESPVTDSLGDHAVPDWIEADISPYTVTSIVQGGCASGAYMPAVTYYTARNTMNEHGDEVLDYIQDQTGDLPLIPSDTSWSGIACIYLSCAVELWAQGVYDALQDLEPEDV
jgi:hypothetical protein